ncbi:MAG: hypothetical protein ABSH13_21650 [Candidatus Acidiferrum sp.]|jgi:hypothetical protein
MSKPEPYLWHAAYTYAILETDESKMRSRLFDAIAAIEPRWLTPANGDEELALTDAEAGLEFPISEMIGKYV